MKHLKFRKMMIVFQDQLYEYEIYEMLRMAEASHLFIIKFDEVEMGMA